jgi:hypothetical protein
MTFACEAACFAWLRDWWARDSVKTEHCGVIGEDGFEVFCRSPTKDLIACALPGVY